MNENLNTVTKSEATEENVLAGIVGAFLFSLAGGILWFGMYILGFLVAVSGLVGVVCAIKGYSIFSKKESTKGIVISTVIAFVVLVIAWYLCFAYDVYDAHRIWYEEGLIDYKVTFIEAVRAVPMYLEDPEVAPAYLRDLGTGLLLGLIGAGSYVFTKLKNNKTNSIKSDETQYNADCAMGNDAQPGAAPDEATTAPVQENTPAETSEEANVSDTTV